MPLTPYYADKVLGHMLAGEKFTPPAQIYLGLILTLMLTSDGSRAVEPEGGSYRRQPVKLMTTGDGHATNEAVVQFPLATRTWGFVERAGLFDAETGGRLLQWGYMREARNVVEGASPVIDVGELTIEVK